MNKAVLDYLEHRASRDYDDGRRRRSSRTGRYMRDRRDYDDDRDYDDRDYREYADERDYRREMRLSKADINLWKKSIQNTDGTKGEHYDYSRVTEVAEKLGIRFDKFDEREYCMTINMLYSDYGHIVRRYMSADKELMFFGEMAKAFLDDPDGPEPSEKLALYYHCIASYEEV